MGFFISKSPHSFTVCAPSTAKQLRPWHNAGRAQKPKCSFADRAEGKEAGRRQGGKAHGAEEARYLE